MHVSKNGNRIAIKVMSVFALLLFAGTMWAQNIKVTGKVTDSKGEPLMGVGILIKGTRTGVSSALDGTYEINAQPRAVLVFTSLGMKTLEIPVNNRNLINISMEDDALLLEDLVVVGYGTQSKANLTGSVATVDTKILEARPIADVGRGLQGSTPGLNVVIPSVRLDQIQL